MSSRRGIGPRNEVWPDGFGRIEGIVEKAEQHCLRDQLAKQAETFGRELAYGETHARHVAFRPIGALDKTVLDRVAADCEHDWN